MKSLTNNIARVAKGNAERCKCGGYGYGCPNIDTGCLGCIGGGKKLCDEYVPCPKCARLRELAELCHHEYPWVVNALVNGKGVCSNCHQVEPESPKYTIPVLKGILVDLDEYEGLINDLAYKVPSSGDCEHCETGITPVQLAKILQDETLFAEAANQYLEGK